MENKEIASYFYRLADLLEIKGDNPFKVSAYRRAARSIEGLSFPLEQNLGELTNIKGIGSAISGKIRELLTTGKITALEKIRKELPGSIESLLAVPYLGPKTIGLIYRNLHISDIDTLHKAAVSGKLFKIKGIGKKTAEKIAKGIELKRNSSGIMNIYSALKLAEKIRNIFRQKNINVYLAGEVHRHCELVKKLEFVSSLNNKHKIKSLVKKTGIGKGLLEETHDKLAYTTKQGVLLVFYLAEQGKEGLLSLCITGPEDFCNGLKKFAAYYLMNANRTRCHSKRHPINQFPISFPLFVIFKSIILYVS